MNKETRIEKIEKEKELQETISKRSHDEDKLLGDEIWWNGKQMRMSIYRIPLEYLVYNIRNGRILSRTKSIERKDVKIKPETDEGKELIEKLLWESKIDRNKQTKESIETRGQDKFGIITRDGIIIDGNRRAMLLSKLTKEGIPNRDRFKTIILPVTLEEEPLEIERLETHYQLGEDEKVDYNPIEKYIKVKELKNKGVSEEKIANWRGEPTPKVKDYLNVMEIMDIYLEYLNYDGIYTQLDGREDQFINLTNYLKAFYGKASVKAFDGYTDQDVDDLQTIAFDYIRVKYEGKKFRSLAHGVKENHFFGNKKIWKSFRDVHFKNVSPIYDREGPINEVSLNFTATLNARDNDFKDQAENLLDENMADHLEQINNEKHRNKPEKLIKKSIDAMDIVKSNKNIEKPEVLEKVKELNEITTGILQKKSPQGLLEHILNLLSSVVVSEVVDGKEELLQCIKNITRGAYQLEKKVKRLK